LLSITARLTSFERLRCAATCRAWRGALALPAVWAEVDLRGVAACDASWLLACVARRAAGALRSLHLPFTDASAVLAAARTSAALSFVGVDVGNGSSEDGGAGFWTVAQACALDCVPHVALPVAAQAPHDSQLALLLSAGRVSALRFERAELSPSDAGDLVQTALQRQGGTALRSLSLRFNSVGSAGCVALAELVARGLVEELYLGWNDVHSQGAVHLAAALQSPSCRLLTLDLRHSGVGPQGAAMLGLALRSRPALTSLSLRGCAIGAGGAAALASGLRSSRQGNITRLDLGHCALGRAGITALADSGCLRRLAELGLAHNSICHLAAADLAAALAHAYNLEVLDIGRNALGDEGLRLVCCALRSHTKLQRLDVPLCAGGPEAARRLGGLLRSCPRLRHLDASGNAINRGVSGLAAGLAEGAGAMRTLLLSHTGIGDSGVHELVQALRAGFGGHGIIHLDFSGCPVGDDAARALAGAASAPSAALAQLDLRHTFVVSSDKGASMLSAAAERSGLCVLGLLPEREPNE